LWVRQETGRSGKPYWSPECSGYVNGLSKFGNKRSNRGPYHQDCRKPKLCVCRCHDAKAPKPPQPGRLRSSLGKGAVKGKSVTWRVSCLLCPAEHEFVGSWGPHGSAMKLFEAGWFMSDALRGKNRWVCPTCGQKFAIGEVEHAGKL